MEAARQITSGERRYSRSAAVRLQAKCENGLVGPAASTPTINFQTRRDRTPIIPLQPKLKIGPVNDHYEQEADRVAEKAGAEPLSRKPLINLSSDFAQRKSYPIITPLMQRQEEEEAAQPQLQRQQEEEEAAQPQLQRQVEEEEEAAQPQLQRQEEEEATQPQLQRQEEEEEAAQPQLQRQEEEEEAAQPQLQRQEEEEEAAQPQFQRQEEEEEAAQPQLQRQAEEEEAAQPQLQRQEEEEEAAQPQLQRQEEEEEAAQPQLQRQVEEEEEKAQPKVQAKASPGVLSIQGPEVESDLWQSKGTGKPLPEDVRLAMEERIGADFSTIRIHTGEQAVRLNKMISAQAFTHGRDIYFNQGKYDAESSSGRKLLAHELTHTVQQGAAPVMQDERTISRQEEDTVQGSWLGDKLNKYARHVPGYTLVTVIIGKNPLTGNKVARTPQNFLRGVMGLIPFGTALYDKLNKHGLIDKAFGWLNKQIKSLDLSWSRVKRTLKAAWDEMTIVRGIDYNVRILKRHIGRLISDIKTFGSRVVKKVVELVKEAILPKVVSFIKERTRAYPLLTVILGKDPVTGEKVARNLMNIASGFLMLTQSGEEYLRQLKKSGKLKELSLWFDVELKKLNLSPQVVISSFKAIWSLLTIKNVLKPIATFKKIFNIVAGPVKRLARFVFNVAAKVLSLIKEALLSKLKEFAQKMPGYPLLGVILGKDPVTGQVIPRTARNFIRGFMSFVPGGLAKYKNLEKSGAIDKAFKWLGKQVRKLNLSWALIVGLFKKAWKSLSINDLAKPLEAFARIVNLFRKPVQRIINFAAAVGLKVLEFIFEGVMGAAGAQVLAVLKKAKKTFLIIIKNPIGFIGNLIGAVKKGFSQFSANILKHLKKGLLGWLFGALEGAGIQLPETFDLKGIISLVMQILGVTYARIRKKLVKHLGEDIVAKAEKTFEFVKKLVTDGPGAAWEKLKESISNIKEMILSGIREWVVTKVVIAAVTKIASMLNPAGAVIQAILAIYNTIMFFIERINQIAALVKSVVDSVASIAIGKIAAAANFVEQTMGKTIPVIISFLARLLGLGNIAGTIKKIIKKIHAVVDRALNKIIGAIVRKAKKLFGMGKAALNKGKAVVKAMFEWWRSKKTFKSKDGAGHSVFFKGQGKGAVLTMASKPLPLTQHLDLLEKKIPANDSKSKNVIKEVRKRAYRIEDIKKKNDESGKVKNVSHGQALGKRIAALLAEIASRMATLNIAGEVTARPVSKPVFRPRSWHGSIDGRVMVAAPLTIKAGSTTGSEPFQESALWNKVKVRKGAYIRGHLLNHHLHGPGENRNLTPIPGGDNTRMESNFESKVKNAVLQQNKVVSYQVTVKHGGHGKREHIPEESALAKSIRLTAYEMKPTEEAKSDPKKAQMPQNWKVDKQSPIFPVSTMTITLPPDTKPTDTLPDKVNINTAGATTIANVLGIASSFASHIVNRRNAEGKRYSDLSNLINRLTTWELEKGTEGKKLVSGFKAKLSQLKGAAEKLEF